MYLRLYVLRPMAYIHNSQKIILGIKLTTIHPFFNLYISYGLSRSGQAKSMLVFSAKSEGGGGSIMCYI